MQRTVIFRVPFLVSDLGFLVSRLKLFLSIGLDSDSRSVLLGRLHAEAFLTMIVREQRPRTHPDDEVGVQVADHASSCRSVILCMQASIFLSCLYARFSHKWIIMPSLGRRDDAAGLCVGTNKSCYMLAAAASNKMNLKRIKRC